MRFNPFPKLNCFYGAPMGRRSTRHDFEGVTRFAVSKPQGEYDAGGAYWGCGYTNSTWVSGGPVWAVWEYGKGSEGVAYVRARSRTEAISVAIGEVQS